MGQMQENYGRLRIKRKMKTARSYLRIITLTLSCQRQRTPSRLGVLTSRFSLKLQQKENFPDRSCDHLSVAGGG